MTADLTVVGGACLAGGVGLIAFFVHLRNHAERFRKDGREQHAAIRSRLLNQFILEYLTKSIQQIDNILKRSPEFAEVRKRLIKAMTENKDTAGALDAVKSLIEKIPPTTEEYDQLKELTEGLTSKFGESEKVSKLYNAGWNAEDKCSGHVLQTLVCLFGLGFLIIFYSIVGDSFQTGALLIGGMLILIIVMSSMNATEKYREARSAQLEFNEMVDKELYSLPSSGSK